MERLTIRDKDGLLAHSRFKGDWASQNILQSLADYEDAEEQGLLLRLPCKVGSTVWWLNGKFLMECEIESFIVDEDGVSFAHIRYLHDKEHNRYYGHNLDIKELGTRWFLTKEETEQTLIKMEGR